MNIWFNFSRTYFLERLHELLPEQAPIACCWGNLCKCSRESMPKSICTSCPIAAIFVFTSYYAKIKLNLIRNDKQCLCLHEAIAKQPLEFLRIA